MVRCITLFAEAMIQLWSISYTVHASDQLICVNLNFLGNESFLVITHHFCMTFRVCALWLAACQNLGDPLSSWNNQLSLSKLTTEIFLQRILFLCKRGEAHKLFLWGAHLQLCMVRGLFVCICLCMCVLRELWCLHITLHHFKSANIASWNSLCDSFLREERERRAGRARRKKDRMKEEWEKIETGPKGEKLGGARQAGDDRKRVQERRNQMAERRRKMEGRGGDTGRDKKKACGVRIKTDKEEGEIRGVGIESDAESRGDKKWRDRVSRNIKGGENNKSSMIALLNILRGMRKRGGTHWFYSHCK